MADEFEVRHLDGLRADVADGRAPRLVGYAIRTGVLSEDLGGFREVIAPEAVRRVVDANADLVALFDHDSRRVLGRQSAKTLRVAADDVGLKFEVDVPEHERGLVASVARGDIRGASFAFRKLPGGDTWDFETTPPTRTLTAIEIRELSVTVFPAFPQTHVAALRSLAQARAETPTPPLEVRHVEPTPNGNTPAVVDLVPPVPPVVTDTRDVEVVDESRVLRPGDSFRAFIEREGKVDPAYRSLSFGAFLRSMITGPKTEVERRALAEGADASGGITVPVITLSRFIDRLRAAMVVMRAGAQTVPLTSDTVTIAKLATDVTVAWRAENAEITAADPTFGSVQFVPRSLAALVRVSRELVEDSLNIEAMLERSFAETMGREVDRVCLAGTGTPPEPRGITATVGINTIAVGGALTNYDPIINGLYENWLDNVPDTSAIIMHPRTFATLAKLKQATELAPLPPPPAIAGIPILQTTALSIVQAPGTATTVIAGDFSRLLVGMRSSMRLEILRERYGEFLQLGFLAHLRMDVAVEHPQAFVTLTGIVP
jgi:HK97 family phage major capsid protein/HK97 family phage prohead protease